MLQLIRVPSGEMQECFYSILLHYGLDSKKASLCAKIFTDNSLEGVYSHGVNRFSRFIDNIRRGYIRIEATPKKVASAGNLEQWDGQFGPGPVNASMATDRSMELAEQQGLGMVALSNTNHWMRGGTYGWNCAKKGYAFIGWTNTIANLPPWGAKKVKLGNNPLIIAVPYGKEAVVLDMAMSQYSYGKMKDMATKGQTLPLPGGFDQTDNMTVDPSEILYTKRPLPAGYWKGAGLALMLDLLATTLSGGLSTSQITQQGQEEYGVSQVFTAISLNKLPNYPAIEETLRQVIEDYLSAETVDQQATIRYPGQNILKIRNENMKQGIPVHPLVWKEIEALKPRT